jgi:hypothetical protein
MKSPRQIELSSIRATRTVTHIRTGRFTIRPRKTLSYLPAFTLGAAPGGARG